jgi:hypothetical protein
VPRLHPSQYAEAIEQHIGFRYTCCKCEVLATWFYAPSGPERDRAYCDLHVPRGCSCSEGETDYSGRELPCVEYMHDENGFRLPRAPKA